MNRNLEENCSPYYPPHHHHCLAPALPPPPRVPLVVVSKSVARARAQQKNLKLTQAKKRDGRQTDREKMGDPGQKGQKRQKPVACRGCADAVESGEDGKAGKATQKEEKMGIKEELAEWLDSPDKVEAAMEHLRKADGRYREPVKYPLNWLKAEVRDGRLVFRPSAEELEQMALDDPRLANIEANRAMASKIVNHYKDREQELWDEGKKLFIRDAVFEVCYKKNGIDICAPLNMALEPKLFSRQCRERLFEGQWPHARNEEKLAKLRGHRSPSVASTASDPNAWVYQN